MYKIFEKLLKLHNVTAYKVSKDTNLPYSTFSEWKSGRTTPNKEKLVILADYFNTSVDYLLGRESEMEMGLTFSSDEEAENFLFIMGYLEKLNSDGIDEVKAEIVWQNI